MKKIKEAFKKLWKVFNKDPESYIYKEKLFILVTKYSALFILVILLLFFLTLVISSFSSIINSGIHFLFGANWDPNQDIFGALPFLLGTLITSILALLISVPFAISISIFFGEYFPTNNAMNYLKSAIELLAGIPSVVYGFWGLMVLVPLVRSFEISIGVIPYGVGILSASLVLAVMIIPYSASIAREVIQLVPNELKEAALSLGATRYEVIKSIVLPYARSGIVAGILLSLGRALGETMAVTMVIGNSNFMPKSIFQLGNTMASVIANEFGEAFGKLYLSSLIEIGLVLFLVTTIINMIGKYIIRKMNVHV